MVNRQKKGPSTDANNVRPEVNKGTSIKIATKNNDDSKQKKKVVNKKTTKHEKVVNKKANIATSTSSGLPFTAPQQNKKTTATHPVDADIICYYPSHSLSSFHVVQGFASGIWYDAVLNQCNINNNNNKYYRIQMLKSTGGGYYVWFKWGRVGEKSTGRKLEGPFNSEENALSTFAKKYKSKTGNTIDADPFVPRKGKYLPLEIDNDVEVPSEFSANQQRQAKCPNVEYLPSKLDEKTKDLIQVLFSKEMRNEALSSFNLDLKRLPLGVPSKQQIQCGVAILDTIEEKINGSKNVTESYSDLSSQFYTAIPHSFGRSRPPVIQNQQILQERYDMCNILLDMFSTNETVRKVEEDMKDMKKEKIQHPVDLHYSTLNTDLSILDHKSDEFGNIQTYFDKTKSSYSNAKLLDVWSVDRNGERERYHQFNEVDNRRLLWHGTNIAVVAPILFSGLRIMPHSGGRVGAGIYLASMQEKSASYTSGYGSKYACMFLVEAALGKMYEVTSDGPHASGLRKAPSGFDSVLAVGKTGPKKWIEIDVDGNKVKIGCGKETKANVNSSFGHDEFLVYEEAQVRIRYVLTVKL